MDRKDVLTRILAILGTVLVWTPILFTVLTSIVGTISSRVFRFDYLMPAELFPIAFVGALLLLWAARRAKSHQKLIGWGLGGSVAFLAGGQLYAVITGLASGVTEPAGFVWAVALASIALYSLALVMTGIAGMSLVRWLYLSQ
ncbi:MAG TPA: hypothetical protein PLM91_10845 [Bacillota bacterium]|jgi:hypothetical protein|nr:hypothetical protein [Bacillota bacterium]HOL52677.1 hypothetical protein [Bacillota bacterium]HPQ02890.1 hypothetical protein [Bacillota bacterium]